MHMSIPSLRKKLNNYERGVIYTNKEDVSDLELAKKKRKTETLVATLGTK